VSAVYMPPPPPSDTNGNGVRLGKILMLIAGPLVAQAVSMTATYMKERRASQPSKSVPEVTSVGLTFHAACLDRTDPVCMLRDGVWGKHAELSKAIRRVRCQADTELHAKLRDLEVKSNHLAEVADSVDRANPSSIEHVRLLAKDFLETLNSLN